MAAPSITTDLDLISDAEDISASGGVGGTWTSFNGTGGSSLGPGPDFALQGNNAIDMKISAANGTRGPVFGPNTPQSLPAGQRWFIWTYVATPGILTTNSGVGTAYGQGLFFGNSVASNGARYIFNVADPDTFGAASRVGQCYMIDPGTGPGVAGETNGSPSEPWDYIGSVASFSATSKGSNFATDAIRRGTGLYITAGEAADPILVTNIGAFDALKANRYGVLVPLGGGTFELQGVLAIGQNNSGTPTLAYMEDNSGFTISAKRLFGANQVGATKFIIDGSGTICNIRGATFTTASIPAVTRVFDIDINNGTVDWRSVTLTGIDVTCNANATVSFTRCSFSQRVVNASLADSTLVAPSANHVFTSCNFTQNNTTTQIQVSNLNQLVNCTFTFNGSVTGHAIDLGTVSSAQTMNWTGTSEGYTATDGNQEILVNYTDTTNPLIISVGAGYTTPNVKNIGPGTVSVVVAQTSLTVSNVVAGSDVVIKSSGTTTKLQDDQDIAGTTSVYTYTYSAGTFVDVAVYAEGYVPYFVNGYELGASNATLPVAQVVDRNYTP